MKKILWHLTASAVLALLVCITGFALTLDSAEASDFTVSSDSALASVEEYDLIFHEDFEGFTSTTTIVTGGYAPVRTPAKIEHVGLNWGEYSDKFYIDVIDSFPGLKILTDSMTGTNKALHMDRFSNSGGNPGISIYGSTSPKAIGISKSGEYVFSFDFYVPATIQQATYAGNGNANGLKADKRIRFRAEYADGTMTSSSVLITSDMIGSWQSAELTFSIPEGTSLNLIRVYTDVADEFVCYFDNLKLYRSVGEVFVYLDKENTAQAIGFPIIFGAGDVITLPTLSECESYIPYGHKLEGFSKGGTIYAPGSEYVFAAEDTRDTVVFQPVYISNTESLIFFEDFEGFTSPTKVVSGGAAPVTTAAKILNVGSAWQDYIEKFYIYVADSWPGLTILEDSMTGTNNALHMDRFSGSGGAPSVLIGGIVSPKTIGIDDEGLYVLTFDFYIPEKIQQATYSVNGNANGLTEGDSLSVRAELSDDSFPTQKITITEDMIGSWQSFKYTVSIKDGTSIKYLRIFNSDANEFVCYFDNIKFYKHISEAIIFLDADKTVTASGSPFEFGEGDTVTLPSLDELSPYVPDGMKVTGFVIGENLYEPGAVYTFTSSDLEGVVIAPSYEEAWHPVPEYGELIFFDNFESYNSETPVVFGGAAPTNTYLSLPDSALGENYGSLSGLFSYTNGAGVKDIRVKTTSVDAEANKALHFAGWYQSENIGVRISDYTLSGTTKKDTTTGNTYSAASSDALNIAVPGNYRLSLKVYVPSYITQMTSYGCDGKVNGIADKTVTVKAEFENGTVGTNLVLNEQTLDSWQTVSLDFTIDESNPLKWVNIYGSVSTIENSLRLGSFYIDDIELYTVDATVTYKDENGNTVYSESYFPGGEIVLPDETIMGFDPMYEIDGKEYFAGGVYKTDINKGDIEITAKRYVAPRTLELAQVRTSGIQGLRYAAFVTAEKKNLASEYGFIVALASSFGTNYNELTFETSKKYVYGVAYDKENGKDVVYSFNGEEFGEKGFGEGYYYTACLVGIPSEHYETDIVGRPYIVINGVTCYGKPIVRNIKEVADASGIKLQYDAKDLCPTAEEIQNHAKLNLWHKYDEPYGKTENANLATITPYVVSGSEEAVIIYPGGGYVNLSTSSEGTKIAEAYNQKGISAFVVNYRYSPCNGNAILADGQRAVQYVRYFAEDFGVNPEKISVLGFSAGGHLATMVCQHEPEENHANDAIGSVSSKPDAVLLGYAVTTLGDGTYYTMPEVFLGEENKEDQELIAKYSFTNNISSMPSAFIFYSELDTLVDPESNSVALASALASAGKKVEIHSYGDGGHGVGLGTEYTEYKEWLDQSCDFLASL